MPEGLPHAAVVIPTFSADRLALLKRCVGDVLTNTISPSEVVVVVDRNPQLTNRLCALYSDTVVRVVESEGQGASDARTTGLWATTSEIIAFIDDDVHPDPGWLAAVLHAFAKTPGVVALGGLILPEYEDADRRDVAPELLWLVGCTYRGHRLDPGPISRPIGSTMAFRRKPLADVGGFQSSFGCDYATPADTKRKGSNEELAVSEQLRARHGPESIWFEPEAVVHHWVPKDRTTRRFLIERAWVEGTSKGDIRAQFGRAAMSDDRRYLTNTLLPQTLRYMRCGPLRRRHAVDLVTVAAVTGAGYLGRHAVHLASRRPRAWFNRPVATL